jgi:hypothetical protein
MLKFIEENIFLQVRISFNIDIEIKICVYKDIKNDQSIGKEEEINPPSKHHHVPLSMEDEEESENSFDDERNSLLDRLGVKIDDSLQRTFASYVEIFNLYFIIRFSLFLVSDDFVLIIRNIRLYLY